MGAKVAKINDKNNKDCDTYVGKKSIDMIVPNKIDLEKSGEGKKSKPAQIPIKIEINAVLTEKDLL